MGLLLLVVLLLVVSPVLLYAVGLIVKRATANAQARAVFPVSRHDANE